MNQGVVPHGGQAWSLAEPNRVSQSNADIRSCLGLRLEPQFCTREQCLSSQHASESGRVLKAKAVEMIRHSYPHQPCSPLSHGHTVPPIVADRRNEVSKCA